MPSVITAVAAPMDHLAHDGGEREVAVERVESVISILQGSLLQ